MDISFDFFSFYVVSRELDDVFTVFSLTPFFFCGFSIRTMDRIPALISENAGERVIILSEITIVIHVTEDSAGFLRRESMRIALANRAGINITAVDVPDHRIDQNSY